MSSTDILLILLIVGMWEILFILVPSAHLVVPLGDSLAAPDCSIIVDVGHLIYHISTMIDVISVLADGPDAW